jgi:hypothetical protein
LFKSKFSCCSGDADPPKKGDNQIYVISLKIFRMSVRICLFLLYTV